MNIPVQQQDYDKGAIVAYQLYGEDHRHVGMIWARGPIPHTWWIIPDDRQYEPQVVGAGEILGRVIRIKTS